MAFYYKPLFVVLYLFILTDNLVSLAKATKKSCITVDLIHRDSPLSPYYNVSDTHFDRLNRAFERSFARKSAITLAYKKSTLGSPDTSEFDAQLFPRTTEFLMKIGIGTPPVDILAMADTGSDLTWTQCEPCINCYPQIAPFFDPKSSTSYRTVSCQSQQCNTTRGISCDYSNGCQYQAGYVDRSYSYGDLALETFTFGSDSQETVSFPNVLFGCGRNNGGTFDVLTSGIVGLGGGSFSIINQLNSTIGGKFSYCLTYFDSQAPSKISFGSDASVTGPNVLSTPLIRKSSDIFYRLTLEGISVGNERFDYAPFARSKALGEEGNIVIDSGTTCTFLPADLYNNLDSVLAEIIRGRRAPVPSPFFRLCYDISSGEEIISPPIVAHFTGADLVLPQKNIFVEVQPGLACLTLVPTQDLAFFGNLHQINYHIEYDLVNQQVNFLPTDCSKPQ